MTWQELRETPFGDLIDQFEALRPGSRIDTAVPQDWAVAQSRELKAAGLGADVFAIWIGWLYDDEHRIFGRPLSLAEVYAAINYPGRLSRIA